MNNELKSDMGKKRKCSKRRITTRGKKRLKIDENKVENAEKTTLLLNSAGEDKEEDDLKDVQEPVTANDDSVNVSMTRVGAAGYQAMPLKQHPANAAGPLGDGQHRSSSEEEEDVEMEKVEEKTRQVQNKVTFHQSSLSTNDGHNQHLSVTNTERRDKTNVTASQYHKSPQLARRPISVTTTQHYGPRPQNTFQGFEPEAKLPKRGSKKGTNMLCNLVAVIAIGIAGVAICWFYLASPGTTPSTSEPFDQVFKRFEESKSFSSEFPNQSRDNWNKIRATVKSTMAFARPRSPGVISLVSLANTEPVAKCMGRKLAAKLQTAYNDSELVSLKGEDFKGWGAAKVKLEIDHRVRRGLVGNSHVVLLEGLHHLPAESGLLFHGLCDTDNAPFKQAIFIFTSVTDKIVDATQQQVTTFWKDTMSEDKRYSLETRIGNNIIVINPEDENAKYKKCV